MTPYQIKKEQQYKSYAQDYADKINVKLFERMSENGFRQVGFHYDGQEFLDSNYVQLCDTLCDIIDGGYYRRCVAADDAHRENVMFGPMD